MASAPLPFSAPNPRSLPTSVNQPLEIVLANWQAQLANLISVTPPQVTPTNFAVSNQRGGMSLSWSPVPSGDGYEILKSANGSFVDDLQIVPIKNPAQCSYFDGTGGAATKVSYRIRTTSGTAANPQSQRGPESGPIQHTSIAVTDTTASPTVKYDTSTTTQTQSLARKGNYGAFRLTGLGKSGGANAGTGGATTAGGGTGGGVVPPPTPTTECPWSGLFGDMTISQVAPWDGPNVGTPDTGISRDGVGSLAIGNGSTGDASGNLDLATILASSSVTAGVNATSAGTFVIANGGALGVSITLQNLGATTAYNFNLPATPGTTGYVLTSQGGGSSSMTWATVVNSLTGDSLLYSNSTSTGAVTLALNTQTANYFLAGPYDYLPKTSKDIDELWRALGEFVASIGEPHLRRLLELFMADPEIARAYRNAPAAKTMHHAFIGGLLDHVVSLFRSCDLVARNYPFINRDLLLTGAFLHDIGKVHELSYARSFSYTTEGQLLGHMIIELELLHAKLAQVPDFPAPLKILVEHLIISHHGQYEFGSPKLPMFPEALMLHYMDDLDSKMEAMRAQFEHDAGLDSPWTGYNSALARPLLNTQKFLKSLETDEVAAEPVTTPTE